jgi:ABC-type polysaccharide/polyol phosphate export permease
MQVAFSLRLSRFGSDLDEHDILQWNPLASILAVVRDPLLGKVPSSKLLDDCRHLLVGFAIRLLFLDIFGAGIVY